ncbi:MAG TPA: diaminopimelate epimerase [Chitinophagales bacterium]|nr:diaminopimelate epimerase [Chitinophagales bacterium]
MMKFSFGKYHGAGNDFILVDNRHRNFPKEQKVIERCCNRRYGIGADGLILVEDHPDFDFEMVYYNADGRLGSMCGNGGRCAVIFAKKAGLVSQSATFLAFDGIHTATLIGEEQVKISMNPVIKIEMSGDDYILDTGSPHLVRFTDAVKELDVVEEGKKIRYSDPYRENGINVNFVSLKGGGCEMRTYERGVEDETLSCGTGTVAVAIAASIKLNCNEAGQEYPVSAPGGNLKVYFKRQSAQHFTSIFLEGPVKHVFDGETAF